MKKKLVKLPVTFVYPEISEASFHFGAGQVLGNILRPDSDWRPYDTPTEEQRRNGVESSACFIEAQQATIASILEEQFDIPDQNFSARFNLIFSNATPSGGDPLVGAQTFRDRGLIPDTLLPFSDDIKSWEEFRSFKGGDRKFCEEQGKTWRRYWEPLYDIVFEKGEVLEEKYRKLRQALKYSPVPLSVYGVTDGTNYVKKPKGARDTHMVKAVYVDDKNQIHIRDTYPPFDKVLPANYNSDFAMRWTVEKVEEVKKSLFKQVIELLKQIIGLYPKPVVTPPPIVTPEPIKEPIKEPTPKYDWSAPEKARKSVRIICDEEKLSVKDKNDLCATVGAESGWNPKAKLENKKNGKVWSTDWGICQINDYYHIGKDKSFPSVEFVLNNPEAVIRWMCKQWKSGNKNLWVAYTSGAYKRYL